ncbi:MAG: discoidin domain-containing protein [Phycisphaerales bacterium]|nr:discoidin domain-containing protein [Phycisphaerales bacterium]
MRKSNLAVDRSAWALITALLIATSLANAAPTVLDDFETLDRWTVNASDGVVASIKPAPGVDGKCMQLDFDFRAGAGFVVIRREVDFELPENYRFTFELKGEAPSNNLEFKLVDPSGDNVWWVNRRNLTFPKTWETTRYKARHFEFAWGPAGNVPMKRLGAIEFAVAASSGGKGRVFIDSLTYEALPKPKPVTTAPGIRFSSNTSVDSAKLKTLPQDGTVHWRPADDEESRWLELDFHDVRELGGIVIDWAADNYARNYDVELTLDGSTWERAASVRDGNGRRDYIPTRDAEALGVRVVISDDGPIEMRSVTVRDVEFSQDQNRLFESIAAESPRGNFPAYFLKEHAPWTIVGVSGDTNEALVGAYGQVEVKRSGWSLEPFLTIGGKLQTWADASIKQSLVEGYIPIPSVTWGIDGLLLTTTAFADGDAESSELVVSYAIQNQRAESVEGNLFLAIRPFQVLPPWQNLNITGGATSIDAISRDGTGVHVNEDPPLELWTTPDGFGATTFDGGDISEYLAANELPTSQRVMCRDGSASAGLRYAYELAPGEDKLVVVSIPMHKAAKAVASGVSDRDYAKRLTKAADSWRTVLNRVRLKLPQSLKQLEDTFRATQAYILINRDGPAIQPGSRTYERSWIRDGSVTSTALLSCGHTDAVREYLDWYAGNQYPDGKVPCVVDRRGPDPVPEHDSSGELIYAINTFYRFTHDRAFLESKVSNVKRAVDYLEALRNQRTTDHYKHGDGVTRACYGLVPESISHEGYSAKPMHSYWDNFFVVKGFKDAASIANELQDSEFAKRCTALHDAHRDALYASLDLSMKLHDIKYLPGCAELGDFDATSTAIAVFPCEQLQHLPSEALTFTFDRYFDFFQKRASGEVEWNDYTPYEIRIVDAYVRMGQPKRARALLDFFLKDQRPNAWRQWAEVVWRDPKAPRFRGDMPHTWVGSALINSVRSMFVYERDGQLVLLAGVDQKWLAEDSGVAFEGFPTYFGTLSVQASMSGNTMTVDLSGDARPPKGFRLVLPNPTPPAAILVDGESVAVETGSFTLDPDARHIVITWPEETE